MRFNISRPAYLLAVTSLFVNSGIPALAYDECQLPTLSNIDVGQVRIVKNDTRRDRSIEQFIRKEFSDYYSTGLIRGYAYNKVDLDGDGQPEVILTVRGSYCGSGGCTVYILKSRGSRYTAIYDIGLSFGRFIVVSQKTNGFSDIIRPFFLRGEKKYFLLQYRGDGYKEVGEYNKKLKVKGSAYLVCGTEHFMRGSQ